MRRFENRKNGRIATLVEENAKFNTVMLEYKDTKETTSISTSTLKRWWRELKQEEAVEEETPHQEVEQETSQEEKTVVKPIEKKKVSKKTKETGVKKNSRVDSEHIPVILAYIDEVASKIGAEKYIRDKQPSLLNYKIGEGRCIFVARKTHKEVHLLLKARLVPEKYHKSLEAVNGFYDRKLIVSELTSTNKTLINNIIESLIKKEDKK